MPRMFLALCLAACAPAAFGQIRSTHPNRCDQLFPPPASGSPSDAEAARITERWLVRWYPTRAQFDASRRQKIKEKTACIDQAHAQVVELERECGELASTLAADRGRPTARHLQALLDAAATELLAAKEHERQQEGDLARVHEMYDAQLKQLQRRPNWR